CPGPGSERRGIPEHGSWGRYAPSAEHTSDQHEKCQRPWEHLQAGLPPELPRCSLRCACVRGQSSSGGIGEPAAHTFSRTPHQSALSSGNIGGTNGWPNGEPKKAGTMSLALQPRAQRTNLRKLQVAARTALASPRTGRLGILRDRSWKGGSEQIATRRPYQ